MISYDYSHEHLLKQTISVMFSIYVFLLLSTFGCKEKEDTPTSTTQSSTSKATFSISTSSIYGTGSNEGRKGTVKNTSNIYANQVFLKVNRSNGSSSIDLGSFDRFQSKSFDTGLGAKINSLEIISN